MKWIFRVLMVLFGSLAFAQPPNPNLTPGALCTTVDTDFKDLEYPEGIARCNRHLGTAEKQQVAKNYGDIPSSEWKNYEFDHLIPLCAGGSNHIENIWPQPLDEAQQKDKVEVDVCTKMKNGEMTQSQAVKEIWDWFQSTQAD